MENLKNFVEKAKTNPELMAKLDKLGANNAGTEEFVKLAAEHGVTLTKEEFEQAKADGIQPKTGELSEEELDAVSGGDPTENRYNPAICSQYTEVHYNCVGFLEMCCCDHYRRNYFKVFWNNVYRRRCQHVCAMGYYDYSEDA